MKKQHCPEKWWVLLSADHIQCHTLVMPHQVGACNEEEALKGEPKQFGGKKKKPRKESMAFEVKSALWSNRERAWKRLSIGITIVGA
jgi:hypothetical protein